jgi:PAS domain S-box-containing protein
VSDTSTRPESFHAEPAAPHPGHNSDARREPDAGPPEPHAVTGEEAALVERLLDSERRLRGSQELVRLATEVTGTGVWEWDLATGVISHNDVCFAMFGAATFGGTYEDFLRFVHLDDRATVNARIRRAVDEHTDYDCEYRIVRPDGTVRRIIGRGRALYAPDGHPLRMVGTLVDVTDRLAEQRLRESEERFRQMAENIDAVFYVADPELNRMLYVSPAYERIWGRTVQSLYDRPTSFLDAVHPDDRERTAAMSHDPQREGDIEYRVVRPDGAVRWVRARRFGVKDPAGRTVRVTGIAEDVTDRKAAEAALREAEGRFRTFMDHTPAVAFMKDEQGRYVYFNHTFARRFGASEETWLGRTDFELRPEPLARALRDSDLEVLRAGGPVESSLTVPDTAAARVSGW